MSASASASGNGGGSGSGSPSASGASPAKRAKAASTDDDPTTTAPTPTPELLPGRIRIAPKIDVYPGALTPATRVAWLDDKAWARDTVPEAATRVEALDERGELVAPPEDASAASRPNHVVIGVPVLFPPSQYPGQSASCLADLTTTHLLANAPLHLWATLHAMDALDALALGKDRVEIRPVLTTYLYNYYSGAPRDVPAPFDVRNLVTFAAVYRNVRLGMSVADALAPFEELLETPTAAHGLFQARGPVTPSFDLHVRDVLSGLHRALTLDVGPRSAGASASTSSGAATSDRLLRLDDAEHARQMRIDPRTYQWILPTRFMAAVFPRAGYEAEYVTALTGFGVRALVRLSEEKDQTLYDEEPFRAAGIATHALPFQDGSVPSKEHLNRFFRIADEVVLDRRVPMCVHCTSGVGRTMTMIAAYMMRTWGFTARQAVGYARLVRYQAVGGLQEVFLREIEPVLLTAYERGASSGTSRELVPDEARVVDEAWLLANFKPRRGY